MIKICSARGGDVIKFAGDALIVVWEGECEHGLAHRAAECAVELRDGLHNAQMAPSIQLGLKVGVGVGSFSLFSVCGYGGHWEYFAAGPALKECFEAAELARSGDAVISAALWAEIATSSIGFELASGHYRLGTTSQLLHKRSIQSPRPGRSGGARKVIHR